MKNTNLYTSRIDDVQIEIGDLTSEEIEGDVLIEIITILGLYWLSD